MSNTIKTGNEKREHKVSEQVINDNSEIAKKAKEQAQADQEARAKAVGLKKSATIEEIVEAEGKAASEAAQAEAKRQKDLKEKNHKLWVLQNTINTMFAQNAQTSLPRLTETEVKATLGKMGASVTLAFNYSNKEKTAGHITISEFDHEVRCPIEGEFEFGVDYAAITKAKQAETEAKKKD